MIDVVYRCKVVPGKAEQAVEWAKRHFAHCAKAGLLAQAVSILQPRTGDADAGWVAGLKEMERADWYRGMEVAIYDVVESSV